ncbi:MAG: histidine kinase dimerization/phosphoacceptor domain -containing protein [Bacillota bacterium]
MSTILVVDDHVMSRQVLKNLLGYTGHRALEAGDGSAALALAYSECPDLIITDIVMPTMDGFEFVRRLRAEMSLKETPVIFYTATYRLPEALRVGEAYGKCCVIHKPSDPPFILQTVNEMLGFSLPGSALPPTTDCFFPGPSNADLLQSVGLQHAALMDLSFHLVGQRKPAALLDTFCRAMRDILRCEHALLAVLEDNEQPRYFRGRGKNEPLDVSPAESLPVAEILEQVVARRSKLLQHRPPNTEGVPGLRPPFGSFLVVPFATPRRVYGWFCVADKLDRSPFNDGDGEITVALCAQAAIAYENIRLVEELQLRAVQLEESLLETKTLFKELCHRTKNNMQIISSLINLHILATKDAGIVQPFKEMQNRIQAMALVHEKLYKSQDLYNIDVASYIEDLTKAILAGLNNDARNVTLKMDIESVPFSMNLAIPCGLIINELMSNALKYAFPNGNAGQINIAVRPLSGDDMELVFSDNGTGLPDNLDIKKAKSLGLKVVYNLAVRQLNGKIELERDKGTKYRIRFRKNQSNGEVKHGYREKSLNSGR